MNLKDYATTAQAAERLGVTPARVRKLCQDGKLEGAFRAGRDWFIPWPEVRKRKRAKPDKGGRPALGVKVTLAKVWRKKEKA